MTYALLKKQAHSLFQEAPWITEIHNDHEYNMALAFMEELIEDYDFNRGLITVLSASI